MLGVELREHRTDAVADNVAKRCRPVIDEHDFGTDLTRAEAATSEPIHPAPTTATRLAVTMASRSRTASSTVRR